jgi:serine/threonine protein kinase
MADDGGVFRGLGLRLRRALTNENRSTSSSPSHDPTPDSELSRVAFIAAGAVSRAHSATDYRNSAKRIRADLKAAKRQLHQALDEFDDGLSLNPAKRKEQSIALYHLALIHASLGEYDEAERVYGIVCSRLSSLPIFITNSTAKSVAAASRSDHELEIAISYVTFSATSGRRLSFARQMIIQLLREPQSDQLQIEEKQQLLIRFAWINLAQGYYEDAYADINGIKSNALYPTANSTVDVTLTRARIWAGIEREDESRIEFIHALTISAVTFGLWHPVTLEVIYHMGKTLRRWDYHRPAMKLLSECMLGYLYRLGNTHPICREAIIELEKCEGSEAYQTLLEDAKAGKEPGLSVAYEHIYLNSVVDLLVAVGETSFENIEAIIERLLDERLRIETAEHPLIFTMRAHRTIARCKLEQGKVNEAINAIHAVAKSRKRSMENELQSELDLIECYLRSSDMYREAVQLSRSLFFDIDIKLQRDQAEAYRRRLSSLNLTHFTYDTIANDPLPIKAIENVGTGAYAVVESIEISGRPYARKSIALPRYNQNRIRKIIQNEISVIRALDHPHIVRVFCTYEEKTRFAIILEPLANCDLEAYLEQTPTPSTPSSEDASLVWKWLRCLSNALDFIHSKEIRHKDIKTRNILIKDNDIVFADFGSSHAFLDEGNSVTEGPAFGHTITYCAPEVVGWQKRGRAADIFSLGCVFTEMATFLGGKTISDYYEARAKPNDATGSETHAYHQTLDLVDAWFEDVESELSGLYRAVIKPMLSEDPGDRPTAAATSEAIGVYFTSNLDGDLTCAKCYPSEQSNPVTKKKHDSDQTSAFIGLPS